MVTPASPCLPGGDFFHEGLDRIFETVPGEGKLAQTDLEVFMVTYLLKKEEVQEEEAGTYSRIHPQMTKL